MKVVFVCLNLSWIFLSELCLAFGYESIRSPALPLVYVNFCWALDRRATSCSLYVSGGSTCCFLTVLDPPSPHGSTFEEKRHQKYLFAGILRFASCGEEKGYLRHY